MADLPNPQIIISHLLKSGREITPLNIYTILDAARDDVIYSKLVASDIEAACLYRGEKAQALADVAPYLVKTGNKDPFTNWLLNNGWGKSWGIFLGSDASLNELRRHFRKFLMVYDEEGAPLYFRYYDPRVLRAYLPTCIESELEILFGPVGRYWVEGEDHNTMIEYSLADGKLTDRIIQLGVG